MEKIQLQAQMRNIVGKKVKSLRAQNLVPGIVYGHGFQPVNIQIPVKDFERVYSKAGESTLVYLNVDGRDYPTIIHDVTRDPVSEKFQHADFYKVQLDEKINAQIALNFVGEAPAIKSLGGILVKNISEIEVEGFPQDLPNKIDVNLVGLTELKSQILIKDLRISPKLAVKAKPEDIVVLVQEPISEEELKAQLETPSVAAEEVEVIKKEKPEAETLPEAETSSKKAEDQKGK